MGLLIQPGSALTDKTIREAIEHVCRGGEARNHAERKYGHISQWDTKEVTSMCGLFYSAHPSYRSCFDDFNEDVSAWNVSSVTTMERMFNRATAFNADLNAWNVGNVNT